MIGTEFINQMDNYVQMINTELDEYYKNALDDVQEQKSVVEAMWYSLSAGGKRIRPMLVLEFCRVCGGNTKDALSAACALEMIHTFSLIHDDLPCMDNDDYRRGRPSCHKQYTEGTALLAGDALENYAYNIVLEDDRISSEQKVSLLKSLTRAVGVKGMIGGQVIDTEHEGKSFGEELLLKMYNMKTGALLKTACEMGCIAANGTAEQVKNAALYAEKLGLAFQIIDDILDITSSQEVLGKPIGSDKNSGKVTYASLNGIEKAKETAVKLTNEAIEMLGNFNDNEFLMYLTNYLLSRNF